MRRKLFHRWEGKNRGRRRGTSVLLLFGLSALVACSELVIPDAARQESLVEIGNPDDLAIGEVLYACGDWSSQAKPDAERVRVDLFFATGPEDPNDGPTAEHEAAVTSRGGEIVHRFHLPALRVEIATEAIPGLIDNTYRHVRTVPDPKRHDMAALVGYSRPVRDSDLERIRELGGRVTNRYTSVDLLAVEIPDTSVPALHSSSGVDYVEADGVTCTDF
jgi:hypothetical protein